MIMNYDTYNIYIEIYINTYVSTLLIFIIFHSIYNNNNIIRVLS
jgi:hypothetical protein